MRAERHAGGDITVRMTEDEAYEICEDEMFDGEDTLAITSRFRDVVAAELDFDVDEDDDVEPEILDEVDDDGVEPESL